MGCGCEGEEAEAEEARGRGVDERSHVCICGLERVKNCGYLEITMLRQEVSISTVQVVLPSENHVTMTPTLIIPCC